MTDTRPLFSDIRIPTTTTAVQLIQPVRDEKTNLLLLISPMVTSRCYLEMAQWWIPGWRRSGSRSWQTVSRERSFRICCLFYYLRFLWWPIRMKHAISQRKSGWLSLWRLTLLTAFWRCYSITKFGRIRKKVWSLWDYVSSSLVFWRVGWSMATCSTSRIAQKQPVRKACALGCSW